jgi:hypothetical protein
MNTTIEWGSMDTGEVSRIMQRVFIGRDDVVAVHWASSDGRKGYKPLKDRAGECIPLSIDLLQKHVDGKLVLAIYPLLKNCSCSFIAADFDDHTGTGNPIEDVKRYYSACKDNGFQSYIFRSKSGAGYHVYIFFDTLIAASKARMLGNKMLLISRNNESKSSFDRLFPAQDKLGGKGLGNPIALPFQGKAMIKGNTLLIDPENNFITLYEDQIAALNRIIKIKSECLADLFQEEAGPAIVGKPSNGKQFCTSHKDYKNSAHNQVSVDRTRNEILADFENIYEECRFIAHCKDDAITLPYMHWWAMITNVVRCVNGPQLVHELSRPYPRYTRSETDSMISGALKFPYPNTCAYIGQRITGEFCANCNYLDKIRYPVMIGIDLLRFADTLSYEESVEFDPEFDEVPEPATIDHVEEEYHLEEDWSKSIDDMDSESWESHMDGPSDEWFYSQYADDEYEESTYTYINRYVCSKCLSPNRISSDIANKILIQAYCQVCDEFGKLIHWKAFKYPVI